MSIDALKWAWGQDIAHPGKKFVLVSLADFSDGDGHCFPGQKRLARMTGQSDRSVRRYLKTLEDEGYITRAPRFRPNGSKTSDSYQIRWSKAPPDSQTTGLTVRTPPDSQSAPPGQALSAPEPPFNPQKEPPDITPRKKTRDGLGEAYEAFKKIWNQGKPELSPLLADNQEVRTALRSHLKRLGLEELLRRETAALVWACGDRFSSETRPCTPITLLRHLDSYAEQGQTQQTQPLQQTKPRYPTAQEIVAEARRNAGI